MKMNPLLNRHLVRIARKPRFYWLLSAYLLGITLLVALFTLTTSSGLYGYDPGYTTMFDQFTQGRSLFFVSSILLLLSAMLLVPIFALGQISGEKSERTYELLITTTLKPMQIILGKLVSVLISGLVFILAPLPLLMAGVWLGGITGIELSLMVLMLFVTAILCASFAMWLSGRVKRTLTGVLVYYGMHLATIPLVFIVILLLSLVDTYAYGYNVAPYRGYIGEAITQYGWVLLCALHPLAATVASEALALEQNSWFILTFNLDRDVMGEGFMHIGNLYLPSPWMLFTVGALLVSVLLVWSAARTMRKPKKK